MTPPTDLEGRLAAVQLLLLDCDGVLTDGGVTWSDDGVELKTFHIRDGLGIRGWQRAGGRTGIITGRSSRIVERRAAELGHPSPCRSPPTRAGGVRKMRWRVRRGRVPGARLCRGPDVAVAV